METTFVFGKKKKKNLKPSNWINPCQLIKLLIRTFIIYFFLPLEFYIWLFRALKKRTEFNPLKEPHWMKARPSIIIFFFIHLFFNLFIYLSCACLIRSVLLICKPLKRLIISREHVNLIKILRPWTQERTCYKSINLSKQRFRSSRNRDGHLLTAPETWDTYGNFRNDLPIWKIHVNLFRLKKKAQLYLIVFFFFLAF